jgi:tetratricopeptide (TPR) repeat protein
VRLPCTPPPRAASSTTPRLPYASDMPKAPRERPRKRSSRPTHRGAILPRDVEEEVRRAARPGRAAEASARLARAVELLERGDARRAVIEAEKAKVLAPRSPAAREVLGIALYRLERFGAALSELQSYRRMSGRADQNHLIADCLRALGRAERVVPLVEEALRAKIPNETKAEAVIVAASALADRGRYEEALAFLRRARTSADVGRDYVLRLWYATGDILAKAGRREEAADEFRKILRHDAGAFDAAERLAALG